jgi:hypothetical protein
VVTSVNNDFSACMDTCKAEDTACLRVAEGGFERRECVKLFNACTDSCNHASLQITVQVLPSVDTGRFNLLLDGSAVLSAGANGATTGDMTVPPGAHTVSQTGVAGTSLANYVTSFSGNCNAAGQITALLGGSVDCVVTNTRKPGTGADAQLTVKKVVIPATDPGRFNLLIDGSVVASNAGNNVTSNPAVVLEGTHKVSETGSATDINLYIRSFGGACDAAGNVTLLPGQSKTCIITNHRNPAQCLAACNVAEGKCMAGTHDSHDRQECIADRRECDRACP